MDGTSKKNTLMNNDERTTWLRWHTNQLLRTPTHTHIYELIDFVLTLLSWSDHFVAKRSALCCILIDLWAGPQSQLHFGQNAKQNTSNWQLGMPISLGCMLYQIKKKLLLHVRAYEKQLELIKSHSNHRWQYNYHRICCFKNWFNMIWVCVWVCICSMFVYVFAVICRQFRTPFFIRKIRNDNIRNKEAQRIRFISKQYFVTHTYVRWQSNTHIARIGFERRHFPDYYRMYSTHAIPFANIEVHQKRLYVCCAVL